jgi:hypothetical protein
LHQFWRKSYVQAWQHNNLLIIYNGVVFSNLRDCTNVYVCVCSLCVFAWLYIHSHVISIYIFMCVHINLFFWVLLWSFFVAKSMKVWNFLPKSKNNSKMSSNIVSFPYMVQVGSQNNIRIISFRIFNSQIWLYWFMDYHQLGNITIYIYIYISIYNFILKKLLHIHICWHD